MAGHKRFDWAAMQRAIDGGAGFRACWKQFGIAHATWAKAIARGDLVVDTAGKPYSDARNRYDWGAIQRAYDQGRTFRECREMFGFSFASWSKAIARGDLLTRKRRLTVDDLYRKPRSRITVKRVLLDAGILTNVCEACGLREWRGRPIAIQIDHVNGIRDDHRIENLRMLCPNCHSQTETFGGRNSRRGSRS